MPKTRVQMKTLGAKKANDMARVFQEIFKPNPDNVHIFLSKISDLSKHYKKIALILRNMNEKLASGALYGSGKQQLKEEDKSMFRQLKELKSRVKAEMRSKGKVAHINQISILMYSDLKAWADFESIQTLSTYFNGEVADSFPNRAIGIAALIQEHFGMLSGTKVSDSLAIRTMFMGAAKNNEGQLYIENFALDQYILECAADEETRDKNFATLFTTLSILQQELIAMYKVLKTPEFDVAKIRELIEQAIREFSKSLPGCDLAFKKLLQSLDTFTNNFDNYYENFNSQSKEPLVLLTGFIQDVEKQYEGVDNQECRKLLRQFKQIQVEFAKRLGSKMDNPVIKALYDQLCAQLGNAEKLVGVDSDPTNPKEEYKQ